MKTLTIIENAYKLAQIRERLYSLLIHEYIPNFGPSQALDLVQIFKRRWRHTSAAHRSGNSLKRDLRLNIRNTYKESFKTY